MPVNDHQGKKASEYTRDIQLNKDDILIGKDNETPEQNKNYPLRDFKNYVFGGIGESGQVIKSNGDGTWGWYDLNEAVTTTTTTTSSATTTTTTSAVTTTTTSSTTTTTTSTTTTTTAAPTTTTTTAPPSTPTTTTTSTTTTTTEAPYSYPTTAGAWYHNGYAQAGVYQGFSSVWAAQQDSLANGRVAFYLKDSGNNICNSKADVDESYANNRSISVFLNSNFTAPMNTNASLQFFGYNTDVNSDDVDGVFKINNQLLVSGSDVSEGSLSQTSTQVSIGAFFTGTTTRPTCGNYCNQTVTYLNNTYYWLGDGSIPVEGDMIYVDSAQTSPLYAGNDTIYMAFKAGVHANTNASIDYVLRTDTSGEIVDICDGCP